MTDGAEISFDAWSRSVSVFAEGPVCVEPSVLSQAADGPAWASTPAGAAAALRVGTALHGLVGSGETLELFTPLVDFSPPPPSFSF